MNGLRLKLGDRRFRVGDVIAGKIVSVTENSVKIDSWDSFSPIEIPLSTLAIEADDVRVSDKLIHYADNPKNNHLLLPVEMTVTHIDHGWVFVDAEGYGPFPFDKAVKMFHSRPEPPKEQAKTLWEYLDEQRKSMPYVTAMNFVEETESSFPAKDSQDV